VADDSFEKMKKGAKKSGQGVKDTTAGVIETAEGVNDAAEGVIEGVKDAVEGMIEGVKDTADVAKEGIEDTADVAKEGIEDTADVAKEGIEDTADVVEETADDATDPDAYTYKAYSEERKSTRYDENRGYNKSEREEPMNPEDIAGHDPTAVKRDQGTDIAEEGQTATDSPEAREKFKKKGMTDAKE
jgi:hypothetical protein